MTTKEIAMHAGGGITERDAELALKIAGLLLGRPLNEALAIGPARLVAAYRVELAAGAKISEEEIEAFAAGKPRDHMSGGFVKSYGDTPAARLADKGRF